MSKPKNKITEKIKTAIPGGWIAFTTCLLLFLYAPLELYMTNQEEFWFSLSQIGKAALENFVIFFLLNISIIFISASISPTLCRILTGIETVLLLSSYIQGTFLLNNLPPFDGTTIRWEDYNIENIKTLLIWVIVSILVCIIHILFNSRQIDLILKTTGICLGLMLITTMMTLGITTKAYMQRTTYNALSDGQYEFSPEQNFIILLLDAVDAKAFETAISSSPAGTKTFDDFTYYPDITGVYPWTAYSTPYILSGVWYEGNEYYLDYTARAVEESKLFSELTKRDYDIALYESDTWITSYTYQFSNMVELKHEIYVWKYFKRAICKLGGIRYAPFFLKEYCYASVQQTNGQHKVSVDESNPLYTWDIGDFVAHMEEEPVSYYPDKCFKYYHLQGGHVPFNYDANLTSVGNSSYEEMLLANIKALDLFLEKLKAADVYDNSVIIIMSDHGFDPKNETSAYGRQNPIFLVKGVNETHPLQTSLTPASYEDLQEAYVQLLQGAPGSDIFPYKEGDTRERRYIFYENTSPTMYECVHTGDAWDENAYSKTGVTYKKK